MSPQENTPTLSHVEQNSAFAQQIIPLANPKYVKHGCELCNKPAHYKCPKCRSTYYCDKDHFKLDSAAIHTSICAILKRLRTPVSFLGTNEERKEKEQETLNLKSELLLKTQTHAQKLLFESQFEHAIPTALQALRCAISIHGQDSLELVPCYLLLGEASIGQKHYDQAETYLASAKWALSKQSRIDTSKMKLKSSSVTESEQIKVFNATLSQKFGLLNLSRNRIDVAVTHLSQAIFLFSELYGPMDIRISGAYFQLGKAFSSTESKIGRNGALSAFTHVINVWACWFAKHLRNTCNDSTQSGEFLDPANSQVVITHLQEICNQLDVAQCAECTINFNSINAYTSILPRLQVKVGIVMVLFFAGVSNNDSFKIHGTNVMALIKSGWLDELDVKYQIYRDLVSVVRVITENTRDAETSLV